MDALQRAAHSLHRDASTAAAATLAETIRQGCKDVQTRAVFLAQVHTTTRVTRRRLLYSSQSANIFLCAHFVKARPQRHIASHLSSTAIATEDLNYPECLLAQESDSSSHAAPAPSAMVEGVSRSSAHVFPVLAASLTFLRRMEIALETSVFERLVGEVAPTRFVSGLLLTTDVAGAARSLFVDPLVTAGNQHPKRENSRAFVRVPVSAAAARSNPGAVWRAASRACGT
jgi:hypothetical protein